MPILAERRVKEGFILPGVGGLMAAGMKVRDQINLSRTGQESVV